MPTNQNGVHSRKKTNQNGDVTLELKKREEIINYMSIRKTRYEKMWYIDNGEKRYVIGQKKVFWKETTHSNYGFYV